MKKPVQLDLIREYVGGNALGLAQSREERRIRKERRAHVIASLTADAQRQTAIRVHVHESVIDAVMMDTYGHL